MNLKISDEWLNKQKFVIFGAGILGKSIIDIFKHYDEDNILCFVDNDIKKQNQRFFNYSVISLEEYINNYNNFLIILACSQNNRKKVENQLEQSGLIQNKNFMYIDEFKTIIMPRYILKYHNETYMYITQISITERCTLKCKKCAHGCYNVPFNTSDLSLTTVKKSADSLFSKVNYIEQFHLIGGETFLYKGLSEAIIYIGEKYRNQIQFFCLTTNGTILPSDKTLAEIKKYDMTIYISNYTKTLPNLKHKLENLIQTLKNYNIKYDLANENITWQDYGFDYVDRGFFNNNVSKYEKEKKLKEIFSACKTPCREIRGNKLYFCVQARASADNLGFSVGRDDYLDLDTLDNDDKSKKIITDFDIGIFNKGYLDMCNYCNGAERFNHLIPAAEQLIITKG